MVLAMHADPALGVEAGEPDPVARGEGTGAGPELDSAMGESAMVEDRDEGGVDQVGRQEDCRAGQNVHGLCSSRGAPSGALMGNVTLK